MTRRAPLPALQVEQLEDRLTPAGSVIPAGEFNWTQYSSTGELGQLVWNGGTLVYRSRVAGEWQDTAVASSGTFTAGQYNSSAEVEKASQTAQLVFTSDGTPHVLFLEKQWNGGAGKYQTHIQHYARTTGGWQRVETIAPKWLSQWGPNNLVAEAGANNSIHLIFTETNAAATGVGNFGTGALYYATNAGGGWGFAKIADTADLSQDVWFTGGRWTPRFLSLAVDSANAAHVTYTPQFYIAGAFSTVNSTLMYATNRSGGWASQTVMSPHDGTADAGLGASVAVAPNGQVAIASYYVDRYNTGSPQSSQLMYHTQSGGGWAHATITATPDGYAAGDGARFTGFAPQLYFDEYGRANIVFSDEAGEHLPVSYANQYSGQIRQATLNGSSWSIQTVFRQSDPIRNQLFYPVAATYNGQTTFAGLQAIATVDGNRNPTRTDFSLVSVSEPYGLSSPAVPTLPSVVAPGEPDAVGAPAPPEGGPTGWAVSLDNSATQASQVFVFRPDGSLAMSVTPYGTGFRGGVRFARADINGDGVTDLITVPGVGIEARVRVWDGATAAMIADFAPAPGYAGGLWVAAGDVNGDGTPDIVVGLDQINLPAVGVYSGRDQSMIGSFFAYPPGQPGGVRVGVGDVNRDGYADIITAPGAGVAPLISTFSGRSVGGMGQTPQKLAADYFAYASASVVGVNLAVGDLDGDGYADVITGPGRGLGHLRVVSGSALSGGRATDLLSAVVTGGDGGLRVAVSDTDGDGKSDLITAADAPNGGFFSLFPESGARTLSPLPGITTGIFVG